LGRGGRGDLIEFIFEQSRDHAVSHRRYRAKELQREESRTSNSLEPGIERPPAKLCPSFAQGLCAPRYSFRCDVTQFFTPCRRIAAAISRTRCFSAPSLSPIRPPAPRIVCRAWTKLASPRDS